MRNTIFLLLLIPMMARAQYAVMSVVGVEPNQTIITRYDKGFIIKNSGERLEGKIQLKVKKSDTVEIRFKGSNGKEVFKKNLVRSFGLLKAVDDYRVAKNETQNFHPGSILLKSGQKMNGRIAIRAINEGEEYGFYMSSILLADADNYVNIIPADKISSAEQEIAGKTKFYENYKDGILRHVVDGKITVMRNPYPTTERAGLNGFVNQAADSLAKEMAENTLEKNLADAVSGDEDAQSQIEENLENAEQLSNTNARFMQNEYLVKRDGDIIVIRPDNFNQWVDTLKTECAALSSRKDLMKYNKFYSLVRFYNSCN